MKNDQDLQDLDEMIRNLMSTPEYMVKENQVNQILSQAQNRKRRARKFFAYGAVSLCGIALGTLLTLHELKPKREVVNSDDASIKLNYLLLDNVHKAYNSTKDYTLKELTSRFAEISEFYGKFKAKGKIAPESIPDYSSKLEELKSIKGIYGILGERDNAGSASRLFEDMQSLLIKSQGEKK